MCIRDRAVPVPFPVYESLGWRPDMDELARLITPKTKAIPVSYTHLRAHETVLDLVCRLLLEKKN